MLFAYLEHWWEVVAPFKPVEMTVLENTYTHPHFGQVIHYMRRLRDKSKQTVAQDLHWSTSYIRKIEASPDGTNNMERNGAIIPYLQIPPLLLGMDEDHFLPDTPGKDRQTTLAQINTLLHGPATDRSITEIERILKTYQQTRDPKYIPLSADERESYNHALHECQRLLSDSFLTDFSSLRQHAFAQDRKTLERLRERRGRERARQGFLLIEHWLEQTSQALEHAIGFRSTQLLYVRYFLYTLVTSDYLFSSEARSQLDQDQKLAYSTKRVECARYLGNVSRLADALVDRIKIYHKRQQFTEMIADVTELTFCIDILCTVLERTEVAREHINHISYSIGETQGDIKKTLRTLTTKALRITQRADLTKSTPTLP